MILEVKFDRLTGLLHESHAERFVAEEILRARRYAGTLSVIYFKPHGEAFSSVYTDLKQLSILARKEFREVDMGVRYSGGLLFLLPGTSEHGAQVCIERLKGLMKKEAAECLSSSSFTFEGRLASTRGLANPVPKQVLRLLERDAVSRSNCKDLVPAGGAQDV